MILKTFYIVIIGCQMNEADGERIAGLLKAQGLNSEKNRKKADLVVIVTCGVRQHAEDRIYGLIPRIKHDNPKVKILFTGCLAYRDDIRQKLGERVDWWLPMSEIANFSSKIRKIISKSLKKINNDYLSILPMHSSEFSAFVPIGNGCDNFCAYCVVPYARGREVYRPAVAIFAEVLRLVRSGYKEIFLIAQNVNSYKSQFPGSSAVDGAHKNFRSVLLELIANDTKRDQTDINFSLLLRLINSIEGDFWIRFATSHPKDMSNDLINTIASCEKVCEHIHLPAQAGDDDVLRRMNRKYTRAHYLSLIKKIRQKIKLEAAMPIQNGKQQKLAKLFLPASITTDVIVGFPGETRKQFLNSVKLFREVGYDMAYVARYSPRPGTVAYKMEDDVTKAEKKRREEEIMKALRKTALANNKMYINKIIAVLVLGKGKTGEYFGYTRTYKYTKVKPAAGRLNAKYLDKNLIGKFIKVKIWKVKDFGIEGEVIV